MNSSSLASSCSQTSTPCFNADFLPALCWGLVLEYASASDTIAVRLVTRAGRERTARELSGRIATACSDGRAYVWSAATGALLLTLEGSGHWVRKVVFSPRGDKVLTASADGTARTFDSQTGKLILERERGSSSADDSDSDSDSDEALLAAPVSPRQRTPQEKCAVSPDGRHVVTAASDAKTARLWDAQTGTERFVLAGHRNIVESCVFSPDSKRIVTSSFDSTARLWDAVTGSPLGVHRHKNRFNGRPDLFVLACDFTATS